MKVSTDLAAIYMLRVQQNGNNVFMQSEINQTKQKIYNLHRDGKLKNHGGRLRGEAKWDLIELHRVLTSTDE